MERTGREVFFPETEQISPWIFSQAGFSEVAMKAQILPVHQDSPFLGVKSQRNFLFVVFFSPT